MRRVQSGRHLDRKETVVASILQTGVKNENEIPHPADCFCSLHLCVPADGQAATGRQGSHSRPPTRNERPVAFCDLLSRLQQQGIFGWANVAAYFSQRGAGATATDKRRPGHATGLWRQRGWSEA